MSESIFKEAGLKSAIKQKITEIQSHYLADKKPWVIGYSGGKDSTVITQLVWLALDELPKYVSDNMDKYDVWLDK